MSQLSKKCNWAYGYTRLSSNSLRKVMLMFFKFDMNNPKSIKLIFEINFDAKMSYYICCYKVVSNWFIISLK